MSAPQKWSEACEAKYDLSPAVPGVHDVAEVRRQGSVVGRAGSFGVGVRLREVVGQLAWPCEHLSALVGTVHDLHLNGEHKFRGEQ